MNVFVKMSSEFNPFVYSVFKQEVCNFDVYKQKCHYNLIKHVYGKTHDEMDELFTNKSTTYIGFTGEDLEQAGYKIHSVHIKPGLFIWKLVKE